MRWQRKDYIGNAPETARKLIGSILVHETPEGILKGRITECEAYGGFLDGKPDDAAHCYKGMTERTRAMFDIGGHVYIYLIYGMYLCMNVVCGPAGTGSGVLLRAIQPLEGIEIMKKNRPRAKGRLLTAGPARLTMAMGIDQTMYGMDLTSGPLYIESGNEPVEVECTPRINIDYAENGRTFPWRFVLKGSPWVSR